MKKTAVFLVWTCLALSAQAQIVLSGTSYRQDFDTLATGLPPGWSVYINATSSSLGTASSLNTALTSWATTTGGFNNYASENNPGANSGDIPATQAGYTDRALGIRQTGSLGDPGAAFVLDLANTTGFGDFSLGLDLQMLSVQARSTTWTVDYRIGSLGDFQTLGTFSDPGIFGSTSQTYSFGSDLNDQTQPVSIRVVALAASTGSGTRDTFGIDNVLLTFTPVPEPGAWATVSGIGLLGYATLRRRLRKGNKIEKK